ncbi:MAG: hypothetical protein AMS21_08130 [Gemmatimonas sp. SG8_38_2]|nr:MAG: hypothetical protein AMS21_08130 [Gemmatimonas sp. SG8_38_2]
MIDGHTGLLVPPGRHRPLGRAIADLLADDARRIAMGHAAREHVMAAGGWDGVAQKFDQIYGEHLAESG